MMSLIVGHYGFYGSTGASALFAELLQYFTLHRRRRTSSEPTEKELERDFHEGAML